MKKVLPPNAALVPEEATKVFTGQIFDVYQWPQKMFDGSSATFEMLRRPDTVQAIAIKDNHVVLIEDTQPGRPMQVHFPGGRVDEEDLSWIEAAQRELKEEAGLEFNSWKLVSVEQPIIKIEWFTPIFLATDLIKEYPLDPDSAGERIKVRLHSFQKAKEQILSGKYPAISYLIPLFSQVNSLDELIAWPEFQGDAINR